VAGLLGAAPLAAAAPAGLSAEQTRWLAKASRHEKAGWTYLHIEGGPRERGFQHGYLLAKEIAERCASTAQSGGTTAASTGRGW